MNESLKPPAVSTGEFPPTIDHHHGGARGFRQRCQQVLDRLNEKNPDLQKERSRHSWRRPFAQATRMAQRASAWIAGALFAGCLWASPQSGALCDAHFIALSKVESNHRDDAIGRNGEVSRYQLTPANWRRHALGGEIPSHPAHARRVAERFWREQLDHLRSHRASTDPTSSRAKLPARDLYALWHRPGAYRRAGGKVSALPARIQQRCAAYASAYAASGGR